MLVIVIGWRGYGLGFFRYHLGSIHICRQLPFIVCRHIRLPSSEQVIFDAAKNTFYAIQMTLTVSQRGIYIIQVFVGSLKLVSLPCQFYCRIISNL